MIKSLLALSCLILISACESDSEYAVGIRNLTADTIDEVSVVFESGFHSSAGVIPPKAEKIELGVTADYPSEATVSWISSDQSRKAVSVAIPQPKPEILIFEILPGDRVQAVRERLPTI
jgi:hypothetical protein